MVNNILAAVFTISLIVIAVLSGYTLRRCESKKRAPFIGLLTAIFLYTLGHLLEITAGSAEGAFIALKVIFIGSAFWGSFHLLFVIEFCDIKLRNRFILPLLFGIPLAYAIVACTSEAHSLIVTSYEYITDTPVPHLKVGHAPLYYLIHAFAIVCAAFIVYILIVKIRVRGAGQRERANCVLLLIGTLIPMLLNALFLMGFKFFGANFTNISAVFVIMLFYYSIVRHDLFDITPIAMEMALHSVAEAFILVDSNMRFLKANNSAQMLFPQLINLSKGSFVNDIEGWPAELNTPGDRSSSYVEFNIQGKAYYNASVSRIATAHAHRHKHKSQGYFIVIRDITETVLMTKRLEEFAYTDALTGVVNRRHFMSAAAVHIERMKRTGDNAYIVIFDMDHFKDVNDTYGHLVGDKVLKSATDRVKDTVRPYDLFGRYGGEEFILLVYDIAAVNIEGYVERVRLAICGKPLVLEDVCLTVSASFGIAAINPEKGLDDAIKAADRALYAAKNSGRNNVKMSFYSSPD